MKWEGKVVMEIDRERERGEDRGQWGVVRRWSTGG